MKIELKNKNLTTEERQAVEKLLERQKDNLDDLEQMWHLMDLVWNDCECDNKNLNWEKIGNFYSHPIWLLTGLFIEQHEVSMGHRQAISDWVVRKKISKVVDYGGGFGTLARLIAEKDINIDVDIYEPHPSAFGLKRAKEFDNINIVDELGSGYDCLVSTDVLEHVPDPLKDFSKMIQSVRAGGYLIVANCFVPVIECHLPQTFHLRYTFNYFAKMMGLEVIGKLRGSHATIFKRNAASEINISKIRIYERLSKTIFPVIEFVKPVIKPVIKTLFK